MYSFRTLLFLKICPKTTGITEELLTWLNVKVEVLGKKLAEGD